MTTTTTGTDQRRAPAATRADGLTLVWALLLVYPAAAWAEPGLLGDGQDTILLDDRETILIGPADPSPEPKGTASPPETRPTPPRGPAAAAPEDVDALVRQLGDEDFKQRKAASERLRRLGPAALKALGAARRSGDPAVAARADALIRQIRRVPSLLERPRRGGLRGAHRVRINVVNGTRMTEVFDGDLRVSITEGPQGVEVVVNAIEDGRQVVERARAANPAELKARHPAAYELYERYALEGNALVLPPNVIVPPGLIGPRQPGPFLIRPNPGVPGPLLIRPGNGPGGIVLRPPGDDLAALRQDLLNQMRKADVPADKQKDILRRLGELQQMQETGVVAPPIGPDAEAKQIRAYNEKSDELRKMIAELKLPDPGEALPPPANARLGISVGAETGRGVLVTRVLPGSRADKVGVRPRDEIHKVNGQRVLTAKDLRRAVSAAPEKPLVVEGVRDGKAFRLEEKP